ncbi:hypothetical protein SCHPADRAFT_895536 [Schizopora paradoxa]|uniref:Uncharacterized protein n=1 Tax=Schizopora paradoxa TaxID=27342 RepID=A0A0H2RN95_9AGAM|nr:hypothetical protein SCHPADRAFT_895536 [Schizopora paradoxa]
MQSRKRDGRSSRSRRSAIEDKWTRMDGRIGDCLSRSGSVEVKERRLLESSQLICATERDIIYTKSSILSAHLHSPIWLLTTCNDAHARVARIRIMLNRGQEKRLGLGKVAPERIACPIMRTEHGSIRLTSRRHRGQTRSKKGLGGAGDSYRRDEAKHGDWARFGEAFGYQFVLDWSVSGLRCIRPLMSCIGEIRLMIVLRDDLLVPYVASILKDGVNQSLKILKILAYFGVTESSCGGSSTRYIKAEVKDMNFSPALSITFLRMAQEQERDEAPQGISGGRDDSAEITITPRNVQTAPDSNGDQRQRHPNEFDRDSIQYEDAVNAFFKMPIEHPSPKEAKCNVEPDDHLLRNFVRHIKTVHDVPSSQLRSAVNEFRQKYTGLCNVISEFELSASTLRANSKALTLGRKLVEQNMLDLYSKVLHDFRPRLRPKLPEGLKKNDRAFEYERDRERERAKVSLSSSLAMQSAAGGVRMVEIATERDLSYNGGILVGRTGKAWDEASAGMWPEVLDEEAAQSDWKRLEDQMTRNQYNKVTSMEDKCKECKLSGGQEWIVEQSKASNLHKIWDPTLRPKDDEARKTWSIGRVMLKIWNGMLESSSEKDMVLEEVVWKDARARVFSWCNYRFSGLKFYVAWSKEWNSAWDRKQKQAQAQKPMSKPAEFDHNTWRWVHSWDGGWIFRLWIKKSPQWKECDWVLLRFWWFQVDEWVMRSQNRRRIVLELKETCVEFLKELAKMDGSATSHKINIFNRSPSTYHVEEWRTAAKDLDGMRDALAHGDDIQFINLCSSVLELIGNKLRSSATKRSVETLVRKQDHSRNTFMDFATVAIFFSSITATTLQFSFASADHSLSSTIHSIREQ